jgi:glycosyltransferase involved in cell wall biosynthesis
MTISVIIPAFNAEATLGDALASVLRQTLAAKEIVVVDDGTIDGTAAIAASFPQVEVVRQ